MRRSDLLILAITAGLFACRDDTTAPSHEPSTDATAADARLAEGRLHVVWGDPPRDGGPAILRYELVDRLGRATGLDLREGLAARHGGPRGLDRRKVRVRGRPAAGGRLRVQSIEVDLAAGGGLAPTLTGSLPYVTIGCKFADVSDEPQTIATYRQWTAGSTYPGLVHHWREESYGQMDVAGSTVVGWYTLPQPREYYIPFGVEDLGRMATDCTTAADADIYFPQYSGINLQFNGFMYASYGGGWTMDRDGQPKAYGMTWMAPWADFAVYAHEEGHTFWLPHSSGPYGATYDSRWDVMSNWAAFFDEAENTNIPTHTIAFHKHMLGWLGDRVLVAQPESRQSIRLERLARPGAGYLMALVPLIGTDQTVEYSVEARRQVGRYDRHVPGNAVVIHQVDQRRDRRAQVVDPDNNGDPNDAAAQWTVGETFSDPANGITVRVDSMTTTGFGVTITRTSPSSWMARAPLPTPRKAFALGAVGGLLYAIGGLGDGPALRSVHAYNRATNAWTSKAGMPAPRYDGDGAATISGLLYVPGGRNATSVLTKTLYVYNPSANTWSTRAAMPIASGCGGAAAIGTWLYVLTGCDAAGFTGRLHRFAPSTNSWAARAGAPDAHGFPAVGVINGLFYVAGGRNAAGEATATLHVYNPATNAWSTKAAMPAARFGAAGRAIDGKLYVVGGSDGQTTFATTFVYDPAANLWSMAAPMSTARAKLGAGSVAGSLYTVGGQAGGQALRLVERYTP